MLTGFKKLTVFTLILCILFSYTYPSNAAVIAPQKVRIGLFFKDSASYVNKAVASFTVCAAKGLQVGFQKDNDFSILYEEKTPNAITIRKDGYLVKNGGTFNEYDPSNTPPAGEKLGPYHVKIGEEYSDISHANEQAQAFTEDGISAYPVYTGKWEVWTGFYVDQAAAEKDISENIKSKLGKGDYTVVEPETDRIAVASGKDSVLCMFGDDSTFFQVRPDKKNDPYILTVNGIGYRGDIEVRRFEGSDMTVINVLSMEEYLYGVVPGEIEAGSHPEALKAQAVAARTYTLGNMGKHSNLGFDLCNTVHCQVYKGYSAEAQSTNKAIDETKGKKVVYNGKLAQVFYFSSSGGRTEDVKNVWGADIPYLKSVEDKYESGKSWKYNWESVYTADEIKSVMLSRKYDLGDILNVSVTRTSEAGRAIELVFKGTKGERIYTKGNCRSVLSNLYSQWYRISTDADISVGRMDGFTDKIQLSDKKVITAGGTKPIKLSTAKITVLGVNGVKKAVPSIPTTYKFTGKGWGHSVGMSQEGAKGMANAGFTYEEILSHYFSGTSIE